MVATLRNAHPHLQSAGRVFGTPASKEVPKFDPASVKLGGPMSLYKQEPRFYPSGWAARLVQENSKPDDPESWLALPITGRRQLADRLQTC